MQRCLSLVAVTLLFATTIDAAVPNDPFGMNIHEIEYVTDASPSVAKAQIRWVRIMAWWKWMEPNPGQIDWSQLDARINSARSQGLEVLITFTSIPPWANGSSPSCDFWGGQCSGPLANPNYFANFASAVANRYKNDVRYYEIWNEPDWHAFWTGSVAQWRDQILIPGSSAIRSTDPDSLIVGPATFSNSKFKTFVGQSCAYLDVLSTHYYNLNAQGMLSQADALKSYIQTNCNRPFWVTEFGVDSWEVGEKQQAKDYVDAYAGVVARSFFERLFLFHWNDGNPALGGKGFGIFGRDIEDHRRKRSFFEIRDYISARLGLGGAPLVRDTFANVTSVRPTNQALSGSATEVGGRIWSATSTAVVRDNSVAPSQPTNLTQRAGIPFNPLDYPNDPVAIVETDVVMTGTASVGVGFTSSATSPYEQYGQVWARLGSTGDFKLHYNGTSILSMLTSAPSFDAAGLNTIRLQYDSSRNRVWAWVNGSLVANSLSLGSYQPNIQYAGFQLLGSGSGTAGRAIDNFQVEIGGNPPAPPVITKHPSSVSTATGNSVSFSVNATGEGILTYRWQRNGVNLTDGGKYAGVTTPTLSIANVDTSVAGSFRAVVTNSGGSTTSSSATLTVQSSASCTANSTTHCLVSNRFSARLVLNGAQAPKVSFSDLGGFYYASNPANVEAAVKVIDGRSVNGKFWVFHGSLTSLPYTLTVTDTATGNAKTYSKPSGSFCGGSDTSTFGDGANSSTAASSMNRQIAASTTCTTSSTKVCLVGSRFQVRVKVGAAYQTAHPVSDLSAAFTFGNPANPEVVVKVLDGRPVNGRYWVFFGSLTSQSYQVEVTDASNGVSRTYQSPGASCGIGDTAAF